MLLRLKEYFANSSIHGLHYITDAKQHWTERGFWIIVCLTATFGMIIVLHANWYNFQHHAVSFVTDTSYLNWNTSYPAVTVCEFESSDKLYESGLKIYGESRNMNLDFFLRDIAFYYGTCYTCNAHCGKTINCTEDFDQIVRLVRAPCNELLGECKFSGVPFDCCEYFLPLQTEKGPCYSLNSAHTGKKKELDLISNRKKGPGQLEFKAYEKIKIILHSPEDVPFLNHPQQEKETLRWGHIFTMTFQVKEIENDPMVRQVSIQQRNCRFPDENYLKVYKKYSYSACVVDCRAQAQIHYCNCTQHFMPKLHGVKTCNLKGLVCLSGVSETLRALRTKDYTEKQGLVCDCMPSCFEPEYTIISKVTTVNTEYNESLHGRYGSKVTMKMDSLPTERFHRKVVRSRLDLVENMKCNKSKRLINLWADITDAGNLFEKLSVPVIWDISFLATDQKMQRLGISKVLTSQSRELAHVSGYSVVRIDCTSYYSAKLAKALGFAGVLERSLLSFRDPTGRPWIPNVPPPPHGNITVCYDTTFKLFKKNSP